MSSAGAPPPPRRGDIATIHALSEHIVSGDRAALARAITLVESERAADRELAEQLLEELRPKTGQSLRLGISGVPGAGKSTLIDALGMRWIQEGAAVAVLAVDPSSVVSGGSILGDKTRMAHLAREERAYIRPSPTGGTLGGVARKTREASLLCEAAGFDVVMVETVGVGQSEQVAHQLVDHFLVLLLAGAGDELQGIKRGILELADLIVVNKADGANVQAARLRAMELRSATALVRGDRAPEVLLCSARDGGEGVAALFSAVVSLHQARSASGALERRRLEQAVAWMRQLVEQGVLLRLRDNAVIRELWPTLEAEVVAGERSAVAAAREILRRFDERTP